MLHCLSAIMMITILFTVAKDEEKRKEDLHELWVFLKNHDLKLYRFLRWRAMPVMVNILPWRLRGKIMVSGYKIIRNRLKLG